MPAEDDKCRCYFDAVTGDLSDAQADFLAIFGRLRKFDDSQNGTDAEGKTTYANLKHGQPLRMSGPGLHLYTELYPPILMTYLTRLSPEGLLGVPKSRADVDGVLSRTIRM